MKCPTCEVPLVMTERSGVEIDYCPQCRGVWLDRGELDKIIERTAQSMQTPAAPSHPTPPPAPVETSVAPVVGPPTTTGLGPVPVTSGGVQTGGLSAV